ncbi:cytoskeletal protein CcmA (bactofilin family) [Roseivirga pacifica]|jgi:cytoskeletal protein CcmA (bactofilin family)|uniref:Protein CcmA, bactofilin family n=1 Tax=Roseivirga pacifica TaxID=1267423 RepID=A0A1I0QEG4_9BACT|nr:polymer-forming cytoskeletal protein [Roseivirga pacifica]MCO6360763.1 polymer-forming cytoskeletal protein [Roseivirga pacifica]MCO6368652.1 polymer-forming cytoskeletal protein [Roseivirga pacifica]MCO6372795.1 polymer-forming cytoskeletal protein [Roseivirga pacifica]MCO6376854.1 polymer-forming cytoskeletal protein [Roseivirga pacifica]MCO6377868.1 polymer-forming cytoskeletal protein [Roseivirga pacifica]|tara:strand:+ start:627 stop:1085 length:459 start_codon:yes stop_codon:yes gene_type:complete
MSKKSTATASPSTHITQIKEGSVIKGNMTSKCSVRVDGHVTGDIVSEEKIIVGQNGEVGGNLSGTDIRIEGYVNGDVLSNGILQLSSTAKIFGKIFAKQMSVENGAEMNGKVTVGKEIEVPELETSSPSRSTRNIQMKPDGSKTDNYGNVAW